jgi:hypothetical protein
VSRVRRILAGSAEPRCCAGPEYAPSRREQLSSVVIKRKHDHAVEIDMFKAHRRDKALEFFIDLAAELPFPSVEHALQMARVIGHHEIRAQRQRVGLGAGYTPNLTQNCTPVHNYMCNV